MGEGRGGGQEGTGLYLINSQLERFYSSLQEGLHLVYNFPFIMMDKILQSGYEATHTIHNISPDSCESCIE